MLGLLPELTEQNGLSVSWCTTPFSGQMPDTMPGIVRGERVTNVIHRARERIQDLAVNSGHIQDLAVETLKIAGRAVIVPRLRDSLATADVRLSVLLAQPSTCRPASVPASTPPPGSLVYGSQRAELAPAHAQRIIGITGDGDQELIALQACQAYVKEVSALK